MKEERKAEARNDEQVPILNREEIVIQMEASSRLEGGQEERRRGDRSA